MKMSTKILSLLLALAMLLPMAVPMVSVSADETVTEMPTETIPVDSTSGTEEKTPVFSRWNFTDETDLEDFDLYQSGASKFVVNDGMLMADGTDGEQKAILAKDVSSIKSVSVNIIPGDSGTIYGGVYLGAKNPGSAVDDIDSMAFLIKSDYTGWTDAPNRIDIIQGRFDGEWEMISATISEKANGNNLFSSGVKQPLNLKLTFGEGVILLKLSLVSNPSAYLQLMYEVEPELLEGAVGLRSLGSDTCYDEFTVNHDYVPKTLHQGVKLDGTGLNSYVKTTVPMTQKPVTIEAWVNMEQVTKNSRRQAIISNYVDGGLSSQSKGTWGIYTTETGLLYYTERSTTGDFNQGIGYNVWNDTWTHIAMVRSSGVLHVYINGTLLTSITNAAIGDTMCQNNYLTIGYCGVGGATGINSMKGEIGDIRLWSTERTQDQLQANMYRELDGTEEGLIQHWTFDEQTNGIVTNNVSSGLDCALLGHTQIGDQEIKRWDFSSGDQINDFTVYADEGTSGSFAIADGMLKGNEDESCDLKAVLNEQLDSIQSVSVDMHPGSVSTSATAGTWGFTMGGGTVATENDSMSITASTKSIYTYNGVTWDDFVLETEFSMTGQYMALIFRSNGIYNGMYYLHANCKTNRLMTWFNQSNGTESSTQVDEGKTTAYAYGDRIKVKATVQDNKLTVQEMIVGKDSDWVTVVENYAIEDVHSDLVNPGTVGFFTRAGSGLKIYQFKVTDTNTGEQYDLFAKGNSGFIGGFHVGMQGEPSNTAWSAESLNIRAGMLQSDESLKNYGEIQYMAAANGEVSSLGTTTNTDFFTDATSTPVRLQLDFSGGELTTTMTRLDDPAKQVTAPITLTEEELTGKLALYAHQSAVNYDNLTVVYDAPEEEKEQTEQDTLYNNEGSVLYGDTQPWRLTKDLTATPYTLEAWVKIPVGVDDGTIGYIVDNGNRGSSVSMQMITNGNLRLRYRVENADMTISNKNYDVDVDLRNSKWTHVAYTCDVANDTVVCYINGNAVETWKDAGLEPITNPDGILPGNLYSIGCQESWGSSYNKLPAWIADVRMWDSPLSADEIKASMMTQYTQPKEGLLLNMPLDEKTDGVFADLSGNGNTLAPYVAQLNLAEQTYEPGSYSIVVIPDQQILTHYYPDQLNNMYQWIADNREKENIQMVLNLGDMADNCGNVTQWERCRAAWELLPDDLPFIAVPGNHDYDTNSGWNQGYGVREQLTLMNQYFPLSLFENYATDSGFFSRDNGLEDNCVNQWQAFEVNGNLYLVLALEYVPQDDVIAWANDVVEAHPDHQVIMLTHSYVNTYGYLDVPKLWSNFMSLHDNIIMAFSGHVLSTGIVRRTDLGVNDNQVYQMLLDSQFMDAGNQKHLGMVGILRFNADGTQCNVSYYSTDRGMYEVDSNFTLTLPEQDRNRVALVGAYGYTSVADAIAAADGGVVKLLRSTDEAITVDTDVIIDLAGYTLSNVTVADGYSLKLIDSVTGGSAKVIGSVDGITQVNGKTYVVTGQDHVYTATQYTADISQQVVLRDGLVMNFQMEANHETTVNVTVNGETTSYAPSGTQSISVELAAAQMTEQIKMQFVCDGVVALEKTYSIRSYAEEILTGSYSDKTKNLVKWMLNYGAKAQQYFDVNTDDLANTGYELDETTLPTEYAEMSVSGGISDLHFYGASLVFKNKIAVRFYFNGSVDGVSFGDYKVIAKDGKYYVEIPGINPQDYSKSVVLTATKGEETLTVSYSPLNYILRMSEKGSASLQALLNAMYGYHEAALSYACVVETGYEVKQGAVSIQGDSVTVSEANTWMLHKNIVLDNGSFSVDLNTINNANAAGIIFGADDSGNSYYLFRMGSSNIAELIKVENGTQTVLDSGYVPPNRKINCSNRLTVIRDGNKIYCYFRSEYYGKTHCYAFYEDENPLTGNRIGLWSAASGVVFRNAEISENVQPRKTDVLIFGHSYTEMWRDYADYFPEYPSIDNVGLGGSVAYHWEDLADELVTYEPELGIYMIGINDLTASISPKFVVDSMERTLLQIKEAVPAFEVVVTAVNYCPARSTITEQIAHTNALMRNLAASYDWIYYADTEYLFCTDANNPLSTDSSLFTDGLHPNATGYALLADAIRSAAKGENQPEYDPEIANKGTWGFTRGSGTVTNENGVMSINASVVKSIYMYQDVTWDNFVLETEYSYTGEYASVIFRSNGIYNGMYHMYKNGAANRYMGWFNQSNATESLTALHHNEVSSYTYGDHIKVRITVQDNKLTIQNMIVGKDADWVTVVENHAMEDIHADLVNPGTVGFFTRTGSGLKVYQFDVTNTDTGDTYSTV